MFRYLSIFLLLVATELFGTHKVSVPERLFHMAGADTNVSEGDLLYKSQAAGYYTGGGGVVVRSPIKMIQPVGVHLPSANAGCGGIDIYTGGFSFISGDQLVKGLESIASNAAGYAFMLGMESVSPTITNTVRQLQSWANTANGIGISSCEVAARLVGSVWPAQDMAQQHICRTFSDTTFSDYNDGRNKCAVLSERTKVENNNRNKMLMEGEYNIAWEALMSQPYFKNAENKELAEMYMTLVGTFVVPFHEKIRWHFSKAEDNEFLTHLLEGGKVKKYKCRDEKCLFVDEVEVDISLTNSWFAKIRNALSGMQEKVVRDEPLNDAEKGLLCTSKLPLFKIVNVLSAYHRGGPCPVELDSLSDIVSWDVLSQVIKEAIDTVRRGCLQIRENAMYANDIDRYLNDLERVQQVVRRYEAQAQKAIDLEMRLFQKMQLLEKQVNSEIMVY